MYGMLANKQSSKQKQTLLRPRFIPVIVLDLFLPSFYPTMSNEKHQEINDADEARLIRKITWAAIPLLNMTQAVQVEENGYVCAK